MAPHLVSWLSGSEYTDIFTHSGLANSVLNGTEVVSHGTEIGAKRLLLLVTLKKNLCANGNEEKEKIILIPTYPTY